MISVIVPVYNVEDYLHVCLNSILNQTFQDFEIVCIDDVSTDSSSEILEYFANKDSRIRIITENNAGPAAARNKGLARVRGEYVIFLDADDFYEITLLELLYKIAVRDNLDITVAKYNIFNNSTSSFEENMKIDHGDIFEPGKIVSKNEYPDQILQSVTGYVWNKLFKRSFLKEKNLSFNPWIRVFEDVYFIITALAVADRVGKVFEILVHHRVYSGQSKNKLFKKYYAQVPLLYAQIKEFLRANGMFIPLAKSFMNLSASRCYAIYNILWRDAKQEFWDMIHGDYAEQLGWVDTAPENFEREDVREFVAEILMFTHEQHERRKELGITLVGGLPRASRVARVRKKIKEFFMPRRKRSEKNR